LVTATATATATGAEAEVGTSNSVVSYRDDDDDDDEYNCHTTTSNDNKDDDNTIVIDNNILMSKTHWFDYFEFKMVGVTALLRKVITPFVEVRVGDIFLGIDTCGIFFIVRENMM